MVPRRRACSSRSDVWNQRINALPVSDAGRVEIGVAWWGVCGGGWGAARERARRAAKLAPLENFLLLAACCRVVRGDSEPPPTRKRARARERNPVFLERGVR